MNYKIKLDKIIAEYFEKTGPGMLTIDTKTILEILVSQVINLEEKLEEQQKCISKFEEHILNIQDNLRIRL